ncbi:hypothetical protein Apa02nite_043660 [Actinoplanes palleronii]|uniref:Uncharacterized protein n=1 Tax=Actinoplanes palleronii TaxID=113570 RepID=A0ABQ4BC66_9ACTN|nr:hypothetical protein Apa02nite_043660 [Actinoplanes palleronii]
MRRAELQFLRQVMEISIAPGSHKRLRRRNDHAPVARGIPAQDALSHVIVESAQGPSPSALL